MRKSTILLALLVAITLACNGLNLPVTMTPVASLVEGTGTNAVLFDQWDPGYDQEIAVGLTVTLEALFEPKVYIPILNPDGSVAGYRMGTWESPNVAEMRSCFSSSGPCQPEGEWVTYAEKLQYPILVDWLGPRVFWLAAEFRDPSGHPIPTMVNDNSPEAVGQDSTLITGFWDEATPISDQPVGVQTAVAATQTAFPVNGSVVLEGGNGAVGGSAGSTINIEAEFAAASPFGKVTEMRVLTGMCRSEADMGEAAWEPFAATKTFQVQVIINWTGFSVSAQYRDEKGHLSPVYCDDINVEGMP